MLSVWREAFGIIRRYPLASGFPAAVLGMLGAAPYFFIEGKIHVREEILTSLTGAFAFYLYIVYVAYAEEVTAEVERGVERITTRGVLRMMRQASLVAPSAMAAAVAANFNPCGTPRAPSSTSPPAQPPAQVPASAYRRSTTPVS